MQMSLGRKFIAAVIAANKIAELLAFGNIEHLFKPGEVELYNFVREFAKHYGKLPTAETIQLHTGEELLAAEECAEYYADLMQIRFIEQELKREMKKAAEHLGVTNKDPQEALKIITECVMQLARQQNSAQIVDFRDAYEIIIPDYVSKFNAEEGGGIRLGWPTLDTMTGGLLRGDLTSFVGRPAKGKTMQLLYGAHHAWRTQHACPIFVTNEMPALQIEQRLSAMHASVPGMKLKNAELSTAYFTKLKAALTELKDFDTPFWIVEGNFAATVEDLWLLARQLKPDVIFIDGAYLLRHPNERDRFRRVAENCELMKKDLTAVAPVVASWQFAKTGAKKTKKGDGPDLEDIGYTDAIAQVSSLVLAILEDDSAETVYGRVIDILKGRHGEVGRFKTKWDFVAMDFGELVETPVEELQFG